MVASAAGLEDRNLAPNRGSNAHDRVALPRQRGTEHLLSKNRKLRKENPKGHEVPETMERRRLVYFKSPGGSPSKFSHPQILKPGQTTLP